MSSQSDVGRSPLELNPGNTPEVDVDDLRPHPRNEEIYTDRENRELVSSIEEHGFDETHRLTVCPDGTILSGHRRREAAKSVGVNHIPVEVVDVEPDSPEAVRILLTANEHRHKTAAEVINEAVAWREYYESDKRVNLPSGKKVDELCAEKVGVGSSTIKRGRKVREVANGERRAPEPVQEVAKEEWGRMHRPSDEGGQSTHGAYREVQQKEREEQERIEREREDQERRRKFDETDDKIEVIHSDFSEADVEAESVDHIITDPPYGDDDIECWSELSAFADRVLKPGGFCIAYTGKYHLPEVIERLGEHLEYYWQLIVVHDGPGAKFFARNLRTGYKPILVFAKPPVEPQADFVSDIVDGGGREKDDHDWQQAESEAATLVEQFTNVDDRVCDPMAGSGTTAVACKILDRRCVAIDRDADAVKTIEKRCGDVQ